MTDRIYHFTKGAGPILVSMPHVGTFLPDDIAVNLTKAAKQLTDTDWHVDQLYNFLGEFECSVIKAAHSRYVIDLNRGASGSTLYPGQSETELCPTTGFDTEDLYLNGKAPDRSEIIRRKETYWQPYHDKIRQELTRIKQKFGYAILWDAHSIQSHVPRFFAGQLPDLNIGTADGASCDLDLAHRIYDSGKTSDFSTVLNGRFKGGYITRHYGDPENSIHAVQMEISQIAYMDEAPTFTFHTGRAEKLRPILKEIFAFLSTYQPQSPRHGTE